MGINNIMNFTVTNLSKLVLEMDLGNSSEIALQEPKQYNIITLSSTWTQEVAVRVTAVVMVMICTLIGNLFLIAMLTYRQSRRIKRVNIFIINLAVGDLAVACITMTTEILFVAFGEWVLGPVLCKLIVYLQAVTLSSATFLLTGMSIDRYQVIVRPMQSLVSRPKIWVKVFLAWILAFISALPQLFIFLETTQTKEGVLKKMCASRGYTYPWQRKVYFSFFMAYILIFPSFIMLYCCVNIAKVVWIRANSHRGVEDPNNVTQGLQRVSVRRNLVSASKQRVLKMTLTVIIGFLVCLTPYFVISMIRIYSDYHIKLKQALSVSEIIYMLHSAINPVLYGIFTLKLSHIKTVCFGHDQKRSFRDNIKKPNETGNNRLHKLRNRLSTLRKRNNFKATSVIIANHSLKEEKDLIARKVRKYNSVTQSLFVNGRNNRTPCNRVEKEVQVDSSFFQRKMVANGVPEVVENATSV